jgi:hypothetical protein
MTPGSDPDPTYQKVSDPTPDPNPGSSVPDPDPDPDPDPHVFSASWIRNRIH